MRYKRKKTSQGLTSHDTSCDRGRTPGGISHVIFLARRYLRFLSTRSTWAIYVQFISYLFFVFLVEFYFPLLIFSLFFMIFFNLWSIFAVTCFLVTPLLRYSLLVTALLCLVTALHKSHLKSTDSIFMCTWFLPISCCSPAALRLSSSFNRIKKLFFANL